jgi:transposase InsO family protein
VTGQWFSAGSPVSSTNKTDRHDITEIFNTDQGSQYTSEIHTQRLKNKGISMDGKGRATDNICIERFWRSYAGFFVAYRDQCLRSITCSG